LLRAWFLRPFRLLGIAIWFGWTSRTMFQGHVTASCSLIDLIYVFHMHGRYHLQANKLAKNDVFWQCSNNGITMQFARLQLQALMCTITSCVSNMKLIYHQYTYDLFYVLADAIKLLSGVICIESCFLIRFSIMFR
jgi:hypothetical protein